LTSEEVGRRADELYETHIRAQVETEDNLGKLIVIDLETGEYEIDTDRNSLDLSLRMQAKNPLSHFCKMRIGYNAVYSFGGVRLMPSKR